MNEQGSEVRLYDAARQGDQRNITQPPRIEGVMNRHGEAGAVGLRTARRGCVRSGGAGMEIGEVAWFRYVEHRRLLSYLAAGWVFESDLGPSHGEYASLLRWAAEGEPWEPG